jgi:predicted DCC family thiol-disulfide oxidoreductase YuxK
MDRWTVLYDEDCGFCRWSVNLLLRADRRGNLRADPIQSAEGDAKLTSVPARERLDAWHLVSPSGKPHSAGAAVPILLRRLPGGTPLAWVAERFPGPVERGYRWVTAHRGFLGRLIGTSACSVDPSATPPRTWTERRADAIVRRGVSNRPSSRAT